MSVELSAHFAHLTAETPAIRVIAAVMDATPEALLAQMAAQDAENTPEKRGLALAMLERVGDEIDAMISERFGKPQLVPTGQAVAEVYMRNECSFFICPSPPECRAADTCMRMFP